MIPLSARLVPGVNSPMSMPMKAAKGPVPLKNVPGIVKPVKEVTPAEGSSSVSVRIRPAYRGLYLFDSQLPLGINKDYLWC